LRFGLVSNVSILSANSIIRSTLAPQSRDSAMRTRKLFRLPFTLLSFAVVLAALPLRADEAVSFYEKARAACVEVLVNGHLNGTGWIADAKGLIVTASHVLERPENKIEITAPWLGRVEARLVAVDLGHDLALLRIDPRKEPYPTIGLAERSPAPGETVFVLGAPIFRHSILVRGTMARTETGFEYYMDRYNEIRYIAATVPVGMSGAAWLNAAGEGVGDQSGVMSQNGVPVGIAFSSPLEAVRDLIRRGKSAATPTLGVVAEELWQQDRKTMDRFPPRTEGLLVKGMRDDGPAARAGLKVTDLIVAADGRKIRLTEELLHHITSKQPSQTVELTVVSPDGTGQRKISVVLGKLEIGWP
jgi:serine protease Do